jgi:hypothetical protein
MNLDRRLIWSELVCFGGVRYGSLIEFAQLISCTVTKKSIHRMIWALVVLALSLASAVNTKKQYVFIYPGDSSLLGRPVNGNQVLSNFTLNFESAAIPDMTAFLGTPQGEFSIVYGKLDENSVFHVQTLYIKYNDFESRLVKVYLVKDNYRRCFTAPCPNYSAFAVNQEDSGYKAVVLENGTQKVKIEGVARDLLSSENGLLCYASITSKPNKAPVARLFNYWTPFTFKAI